MQFILKVLVATTMVHVCIYTPYINQQIKQVNQICIQYEKLASCLYWFILTVNNVKSKNMRLSGWEGPSLHIPRIWHGSICLLKFDFH